MGGEEERFEKYISALYEMSWQQQQQQKSPSVYIYMYMVTGGTSCPNQILPVIVKPQGW